ncbi:hypothetical protein [Rhodococcus sp. IEGM 1374]|uniref:hypothetical protein n=1 Tax=Rhodococcus sp. IEGM 1374 TaxID=3082221 RepID=UPI0029553D03|nr:hypothetical protein [Rhodococcus sp. IEGM 1374]MDV7992085.1 hypothetical protein [Rhodococcus sp. IEGM 1374]
MIINLTDDESETLKSCLRLVKDDDARLFHNVVVQRAESLIFNMLEDKLAKACS